MKVKKIYIQGMHCDSCEKLLKDEFCQVEGVQKVKIDRKENSAEISYQDNPPSFEKLKNKAASHGYGISTAKKTSSSRFFETSLLDWIYSFLIVGVFFVAYRTIQDLGFLDKFGVTNSQITPGLAFLTGVAASLSSCLAVVGSVVVAFGQTAAEKKGNPWSNAVRPNIIFQFGRILTFFVLGGALGMIGGTFEIGGTVLSFVFAAISVLMIWLGLGIVGLLPSISKMSLRVPKIWDKWDSLKKSQGSLSPFLLGALSFFLPCGFTQSMQLLALSSGSFQKGATYMSLFALGTFPVLFFLGFGSSWIKNKKIIPLQKAVGIAIIIFSFYSLSSLAAVNGITLPSASSEKSQTPNINPKEPPAGQQEEQVVTMKITSSGFEPEKINIKSGVPVKWVIDGDGATGCTNRLIIPDLNISKVIKPGENIVKFTPNQKGKIAFSCWMGMVRGEFNVN